MKAVGQDQQQDEGGDEAHQDGWCQEGSTVTRSRKFTRADVEGLDLVKEANNCNDNYLLINLFKVYFHASTWLYILFHSSDCCNHAWRHKERKYKTPNYV